MGPMILTANGVDLYVEVHGAGDPVLLLHGWPDSADLWRDVIPALTAAGYQVIAPDQRGFGRSSRPADVASYKIANAVADVAAVLDAVGAPTAHVVGHDWGAWVASATARYLPDRTRTLTAGSLRHPGVPAPPRPRAMSLSNLFCPV